MISPSLLSSTSNVPLSLCVKKMALVIYVQGSISMQFFRDDYALIQESLMLQGALEVLVCRLHPGESLDEGVARSCLSKFDVIHDWKARVLTGCTMKNVDDVIGDSGPRWQCFQKTNCGGR